MKYILLLLISVFTIPQLHAQCTNNDLDVGSDTTVCLGDYHTFSTGGGYLSYIWNTGSTNASISVNVPDTYSCTVTMPGTTNLVTNGDFTSGNTGFTSSYVYGTGGTWGLLSNPGQYAVSTNANLTHNNFPSCNDHTSGTGNYMIMNGSSVANTNVWCQTVTVSPNTDYVFSGWFTSVDPASPAQLNFTVDGSAIGTVFNLSASTCSWTQYSRTWTSGATQTTATICVRSQSSASGGNDFAVDDISFTPICTSTDTVILTADTMPVADIGQDTLICSGSTYTMDATDDPGFGYAWSDGTNTAINTINTTNTNLMVTVTNGFCEATDTVSVIFSSQPNVSLGNDTILCPGDILIKDVSWPNASYLWSDNSTNSSLNITQAGQYWVRVTDNCGILYDTINVGYITYPLVDLGSDTNLCDGQSWLLDATYPSATYTWNTGASDSSIMVTQTGNYWVNVQVGNCVDRDTINVTFDPNPVVNLGPDTVICTGVNYMLQANNLNATYLWHDGSMGAIKQVTTSGVYWVEVSINNCVVSDTVTIQIYDLPFADLGADTFLCGSETVTYNMGQPNVSYLWNDGTIDSALTVSQSGFVWVEITNICGQVSDSVNVYVNPYPEVDLGPDTTMCEGDSLVKDVLYPGAVYNWSTGGTTSTEVMSVTGEFWVSVTANRCEAIDTVSLTVLEMPELELGEDTVVCLGTEFDFNIDTSYDSILWFDGTTEETVRIETYSKVWVQISNGICVVSDTMWVGTENCETYAEMPNIFTPNADGTNDLFHPVYTVGIKSLQTVIYNRWGKEVFNSIDPEINWDGNDSNKEPLPNGVYYWICNIIGTDDEPYTQKGTVTLSR